MTSNNGDEVNTINGKITPAPRIDEMGYMAMWRKYGPPECCFTCEYFDNPFCKRYQTVVPADIANTMNACPEYRSDIPF